MKDLIVIMCASETRGTMPDYLEQLKNAGIDFYVHELIGAPDSFIESRVKAVRKLTEIFSHYEKIVYSDAFDVQFYGTKSSVISKIPTENLLWAAEKVCFPDAGLAFFIPGETPWRFANGGLAAGTPENFLKWCSETEKDPRFEGMKSRYDQEFLNQTLAYDPQNIKIDKFTKLFYCLHGEKNELNFSKGLPVNTLCNTHPNFIHANGGWPILETTKRWANSLKYE